MNRICKTCGMEKAIEFFAVNKPSRGGRLLSCRDCTNKKTNRGRFKVLDKMRFGKNKRKALIRDRYMCVSCGMTYKEHKKRWRRGLAIDHMDRAGRNCPTPNHSLDNLQTLCISCHGKKDGYPKGVLSGR